MEALDLFRQQAIQQVDVRLQAHALAGLVQVLGPDLAAELGIVQQQIGQLAALLNEIQLGHPGDLAFVLAGRNANQLAQHVTGIVETQRLVKITGEDVALPGLHLFLHKLEFGLMVVLAHTDTQPS